MEETQILKKDNEVRVVRTGDRVTKTVLGINEGFCRFLKYSPEKMVDREVRALRLLEDLEGIQRFLERPDRYTIVTSYIQGRHLGQYKKEELPQGYFEALQSLVIRCNTRGVYRVGSKHDFLVSPEGNPSIIDFGSVLFRDDKLLRIPGIERIVKHRVLSKLRRIEREFYQSQ